MISGGIINWFMHKANIDYRSTRPTIDWITVSQFSSIHPTNLAWQTFDEFPTDFIPCTRCRLYYPLLLMWVQETSQEGHVLGPPMWKVVVIKDLLNQRNSAEGRKTALIVDNRRRWRQINTLFHKSSATQRYCQFGRLIQELHDLPVHS